MSKCSFKGTFLDVTLWSNRPLWSAGTAQRVFARGKGTHPLIVPSSHIWLWLIWGLVATHSKHTYNGSSRQDYEGSESPQLNGVGWRRWSSSLAWALRVLQSLSVTSRCGSHDGALYDLCLSSDIGPPPPPVVGPWHVCSLCLKNNIVFSFFYLLSPRFHYPGMCLPPWTKRRPFSWVTVSYHSVVIGCFLSLGGLDNSTEI